MDDETRRVGKIEAEIAETRVEMSETIEAIQQRLTPANIVSNATESVRHAASEKVRQMTDNSFMDTIRGNPVPAALIGIGAAWLYLKGRNASGTAYRDGNWRDAPGYNPGYSSGVSGRNTSEYPVGTRGTGAYDAASTMGEAEPGSMTAGAASRVRGLSADVRSSAREMTEDLRTSARDTTRRAQLKFNDVLRDNPLVLGAAAALVGAAVGMSIPATEAENRLMGEARDSVVERAQGVASDAADKVSELAGSVAETAGRAADSASGGTSGAASSSRSDSRTTSGSDFTRTSGSGLGSTGGSGFGSTSSSGIEPTSGADRGTTGSDVSSTSGTSTSRRSRTSRQT